MTMIKSSAFTLVELMIAVVVIGIIASLAFVRYSNAIEKARSAEAYSMLGEIVSAEKRYSAEYSSYTATLTNLDIFDSALVTSQNFNPYSIGSIDSSSGYAWAKRTSSSAGRRSYGMCLNSGKQAACDADDDCNPSCP